MAGPKRPALSKCAGHGRTRVNAGGYGPRTARCLFLTFHFFHNHAELLRLTGQLFGGNRGFSHSARCFQRNLVNLLNCAVYLLRCGGLLFRGGCDALHPVRRLFNTAYDGRQHLTRTRRQSGGRIYMFHG